MKNKILVSVIFILSIASTYATDTPFGFLRFASGARTAGLSGAVTSMTGDLETVIFNPASLYTVEDKNVNVTFIKHVLDINSGLLAYSFNIKGDNGKFAATAGFTSYGSFDYADSQGNLDGTTFGATDLALGLSYSNEIDTNFLYGVTAKYVYAGIEKVSTSALAIDAGILYMLPDGRTNVGLSMLNAGFQMTKIGNQTDKLPLDVRIGINHRLKGLPLLFNFSMHHLADETNGFFNRLKYFSIGGEFNFGEYVLVRIGYDNQIRTLTGAEKDKGLTGFSGGLGIKTPVVNFDYGINQYGAAALLHRFSFEFNL